MATNSPGSGKEVIGGSVAHAVSYYVEARAARLEKSKAWALGRIVELWIEQGSPPLSDADKKFPAFTFDEFLERGGGTKRSKESKLAEGSKAGADEKESAVGALHKVKSGQKSPRPAQ